MRDVPSPLNPLMALAISALLAGCQVAEGVKADPPAARTPIVPADAGVPGAGPATGGPPGAVAADTVPAVLPADVLRDSLDWNPQLVGAFGEFRLAWGRPPVADCAGSVPAVTAFSPAAEPAPRQLAKEACGCSTPVIVRSCPDQAFAVIPREFDEVDSVPPGTAFYEGFVLNHIGCACSMGGYGDLVEGKTILMRRGGRTAKLRFRGYDVPADRASSWQYHVEYAYDRLGSDRFPTRKAE